MRFIPKTTLQIPSPIDSLIGLKNSYCGPLKLLDLSQGIPNYEPDRVVIDEISKAVYSREINHYTARSGLTELKSLVANDISESYKAKIDSSEVLITSGCNQAFALVISTLVNKGEEVIIPVPYYFNHHIWLEMEGIKPIYLFTNEDLIPDPAIARNLITGKTKAIILVNPGNPTGVTIPSWVISEFEKIAIEHDILLVIDETYKSFVYPQIIPHKLFQSKNWSNNIISLHSFSKDYALSGYRIGAVICNSKLVSEMLKIFECMAVCASHIGQIAAISSLKYSKEWKNIKVKELIKKAEYFKKAMNENRGKFQIISSGAFFGWIKHSMPNLAIQEVVQQLLYKKGILCLPGTIFTPEDKGYLRISIANLSIEEIDDLVFRLNDFN